MANCHFQFNIGPVVINMRISQKIALELNPSVDSAATFHHFYNLLSSLILQGNNFAAVGKMSSRLNDLVPLLSHFVNLPFHQS